jgi:predicted nucleic acid-binding protein
VAVYFLDSSAEVGSAWVQSITDVASGHEVYLSDLTIVEVCAAISRRRREGSLSDAETAALRAEFSADIVNLYLPTPMSESIIDRAVALTGLHVLRASDAVQLSTALDINGKLISAGLSALSLVSSDQLQIKAALAEGLAIVDPTSKAP